MIETALFFLLGFLVAAGLALAAAPALWRRAGVLARKRLEAAMPLSREEIEAEIAAVQAEHAMAIRRLEMKAEAIRKKAAQDLVEINTLREEISALKEQNAGHEKTIDELKAERADLSARLSDARAEGKKLAARLEETEGRLAERSREVEEFSRLYEEASLTSSSRQVELVARETDIDHLNETIGTLRNQRKEADRAMREAVVEKTNAENALQMERKRATELERKVERLMTDVSTRVDRLERQAAEIARLKQKIREKGAGGRRSDRPARSQQEKARLEAQVADLSSRLSALSDGEAAGRNGDAQTARTPDADRMQSRLATLLRENKKLRAEIAASAGSAQEPGDDMLRERIANLAAEVVSMAAALQGPDSPVEKALSEEAPAADEGAGRPVSLAERVRALREGSAAAE